MICAICQAAPSVAEVTYFRNVGLVIARRWHRLNAPMCRTCATKQYFRMTGSTLLLGWWGSLSFFFNIFAIIANTIAVARVVFQPPQAGGSLEPTEAARPSVDARQSEPASTAASSQDLLGKTTAVASPGLCSAATSNRELAAIGARAEIASAPSAGTDVGSGEKRLKYGVGTTVLPILSLAAFAVMCSMILPAMMHDESFSGRTGLLFMGVTALGLLGFSGLAIALVFLVPRALVVSAAGVKMQHGWLGGGVREVAWRDVAAISLGGRFEAEEAVVLTYRNAVGKMVRWPIPRPRGVARPALGNILRELAERGGHSVECDFPSLGDRADTPERKATPKDWLMLGLVGMLAANFIPNHGERAIEALAARNSDALVGICCLVANVALVALLGSSHKGMRWSGVAAVCLVVFRYFWFHYEVSSLLGADPWSAPNVVEFASYAVVIVSSARLIFAGEGSQASGRDKTAT